MDQQTYNDPAVRQLMGKSYIAVKVDQSFRPDISNRYHGYDLPATVIFNADGSEIVRQQGYLPPGQMASILQAVIDDPSPGPSVTPEPVVTYATTPFFSQGLLAAVITDCSSLNTMYPIKDGRSALNTSTRTRWSMPVCWRVAETNCRSGASSMRCRWRRWCLTRSGEAHISHW